MSASSSTTRTSIAILRSFRFRTCSLRRPFVLRRIRNQLSERILIERQAHARTAAGAIFQRYRPGMLLDDALDDREAEAGAARARRHIGLGQPVAVGRQADAGVLDRDDQLPAVLAQADRDLAF